MYVGALSPRVLLPMLRPPEPSPGGKPGGLVVQPDWRQAWNSSTTNCVPLGTKMPGAYFTLNICEAVEAKTGMVTHASLPGINVNPAVCGGLAAGLVSTYMRIRTGQGSLCEEGGVAKLPVLLRTAKSMQLTTVSAVRVNRRQ